jgi:hypothetical protein
MTVAPAFPAESAADGSFVRQAYTIRDRITADGSSGFPAEPGRYHLYVSLACPWAHRAVIVRRLLGLEETISLSMVDPVRDERGWAFRDGPGYSHDPVNGFVFLSEAYLITDPRYTGRYTVPCLESLASPEDAAGMARFGIRGARVLGVSVKTLRAIARQTGRNHGLAEARESKKLKAES